MNAPTESVDIFKARRTPFGVDASCGGRCPGMHDTLVHDEPWLGFKMFVAKLALKSLVFTMALILVMVDHVGPGVPYPDTLVNLVCGCLDNGLPL
eukprot:8555623-Alexandrium_andersonii.AAC.1